MSYVKSIMTITLYLKLNGNLKVVVIWAQIGYVGIYYFYLQSNKLGQLSEIYVFV